MLIDAEQLIQAFDDTKHHRSQIQGFIYGNRHVVRDCTRAPDKQQIWSNKFDDATHDASDEAMSRFIRLEEFRIACGRYEQLDDPTQVADE